MRAILYSFRRCPYAMRARMGLSVSAINYEHREIELRDKPQEMLDISPKGTVPVFITSTGQIIEESLEVMTYALDINDPNGWLDCDKARAQTLIIQNDGTFKTHLDRYKYASRYDKTVKRGDVDFSHRALALEFIQELEEALANSEFLSGPKQSLADIAIFPFIRQFSNVEPQWWAASPYPKTRHWLSHHLNSALFDTIMTKHPIWQRES